MQQISELSQAIPSSKTETFTCPIHGDMVYETYRLSDGSWKAPYCPKCRALELEHAQLINRLKSENDTRAKELRQTFSTPLPLDYEFASFDTYFPESDEERSTGKPLASHWQATGKPLATQWVAAIERLASDGAVKSVLTLCFEEKDGFYYHAGCEKLLADYAATVEKNRRNARSRSKRTSETVEDEQFEPSGNPVATQWQPSGNPVASHWGT